eukprot:5707648-Pyramimonas_sp.AAC.2
MPEDLAEIRDRMQGRGTISLGRADEDHAAMCLGLPFEPPTPHPPSLDPPTLLWGGWGSDSRRWGAVAFTDGSGLMSNSPSSRRCGWSAVRLSEEGVPIRAAYGGLP